MSNGNLYISFVICTYNREKFIRKSIECLVNQTLDPSVYEIIVVDNNSTDRTASIVQGLIDEKHPASIRYVFEKKKGLSYARNRGLQESIGMVVAYIDDDAEARPELAETLHNFYNSTHADGTGGKVIPLYPDGSEPLWMNKYLSGFVGKVDFGDKVLQYTKSMKYPAGCNMSYKKEVLLRAGGFNNQLTFRSDDKYIFYKVKELTDAIFYVPLAGVYHNIDGHRLSFENFKKLYLKTGNEEKIRIRSEGSTGGLIKKLVELKLKFLASLLLYLKFLLQGHEIKGRYVLYAQWFTLIGFLKRQVFVR